MYTENLDFSPCCPPYILPNSTAPMIFRGEKKNEMKSLSHVQLFATGWTVAYQVCCPWDFPGKSTGVDCHFLLQGILLTQGLKPGLPHCRQMLYHLSNQGSL